MEDLPNYVNFTGPGIVLYPDPNPWYNDSGEHWCPFGCDCDFLHLFDGDSLDFDWMSQPMGSLSIDQSPEFIGETWLNQVDMSLIGNLEQPALPVDLEQSLFMPPTTLGHVQTPLPAPLSSIYTTQNIPAFASSMSSDFLSVPSTQETLFPAPIPQSPDTSASSLHVCNVCAKPCLDSQDLKRHLKQHDKPVMCTGSPTCTHRTAENRDMARHLSVHHPGKISLPRYLCPETGCMYAIKGFKRRDHLSRHIRRQHKRLVP